MMKIITKDINNIDISVFKEKELSVCIGNFETFHKGHLKLINKLKKLDKNTLKVLISFYPHPVSFFNKKYKLFYNKKEKIEILKTLDLDLVIFLKFNLNLKNMSKNDFIYFLKKIKTKNLFIGKNFKFGIDKSGSVDDLKDVFKTHIIDLKEYDNAILSSTRIKEIASSTNIEKVNKLLYSPYFISSKVIKGNNIGNTLGFKTANLKVLRDKFIIKKGVYITKTFLKNQSYYSITNIGTNPTVSNTKNIKIETHLLNYDQDEFYNSNIKVEFLKYIRKEKKFNNKKELINSIKNDKIKAIKYFKKLGKEVD